jgi:hypothetical protein
MIVALVACGTEASAVEGAGPDAAVEPPELDIPIEPGITGTQHVLAILVNLADIKLGPTATAVQSYLFTAPTSVNAFYQATSHGALSFTGTVVGPFSISDHSTGCNYSQWDTDAKAAATAHGVSLSGYTQIVFVFPGTSACGFVGITNGNVSPPLVQIFGGGSTKTYAHELGHAIGMTHASTLSSQYGDSSDVMGNGYSMLNGAHRVEMGWTKTATVPSCRGCTYTLQDLEATPTQTQVLLIPRKSVGDYYYVSYRVPTGFDSSLPSQFASATSIHVWSGKRSGCSPTSTYPMGACNTYLLKELADGQTFVDNANGVQITQRSHNATTATLSITAP